jgi:multidrug resistance efflux pump
MTIRAPVAGVISFIHKRPGEAVVQGEPVVTIESDTAQYVIGYWREKHRDRPYAGTPVTIRLPQPNSVEYDCQVAEVGPQYAPVPQHQLRDFGMPEYGLPVKIEIPDELKATIRPGELVHVIYRGDAAKRD